MSSRITVKLSDASCQAFAASPSLLSGLPSSNLALAPPCGLRVAPRLAALKGGSTLRGWQQTLHGRHLLSRCVHASRVLHRLSVALVSVPFVRGQVPAFCLLYISSNKPRDTLATSLVFQSCGASAPLCHWYTPRCCRLICLDK